MKHTLMVRLGGIHCAGCFSAIEKTVRSYGALSFQLDYATLIANIDFEGEVSQGEILCEAIRHGGYSAKPIGIRTQPDESE